MTDKEWEEKCNVYIKIHDAVVRDNEELYAENVRLKNAVAAEREACAELVLTLTCMGDAKECFEVAACYIRARGYK